MRTTRDEPLVRPAGSPIANGPATNAYRTDESRAPKARARLAPCTSHSVGFLSGAVATGWETRRWTDNYRHASGLRSKTRLVSAINPACSSWLTVTTRVRPVDIGVITEIASYGDATFKRGGVRTSDRMMELPRVENGFSETGNGRLCLETRFSRGDRV